MTLAEGTRAAPVVELQLVFDEPPRSPNPFSRDVRGLGVIVLALHTVDIAGVLPDYLAVLVPAGIAYVQLDIKPADVTIRF